jgi:hypothetical protein
MTHEEKQSELQRHRGILLATIDYLASKYAGSFVLDNEDFIEYHYGQEKLKIEKYFNEGRLDSLQKKLSRLTEGLQIDLNFVSYIKEKTGNDIDLLENLGKRVDSILLRNEIRTQKEGNDIGTMLHYLFDTASKSEKIEKLHSLLFNYSKPSRKRKNEYSEVISREEKDGVVIVRESYTTGPRPDHFKEFEAISPDGKRRLLLIEWAEGKQAATSVTIQFSNGASGAVYGVNGICPGIKASWKNNTTVVIETQKDYHVLSQHNEVRSFDDCIRIEYVEK